jgi:hypothetical protein
LLKMYDAEKYRCKIREQLFLTARFNAGIWVWRHISQLCSHSFNTSVSMGAAYKLLNYQQIPAVWCAVVKRQWHSLCANSSRNQAVWSQCTSNRSNRFPWKLAPLVEVLPLKSKFVCCIPDGVYRIFNWLNTSGLLQKWEPGIPSRNGIALC